MTTKERAKAKKALEHKKLAQEIADKKNILKVKRAAHLARRKAKIAARPVVPVAAPVETVPVEPPVDAVPAVV